MQNSTLLDSVKEEENISLVLLKMKARRVVGRVEKSLLCDPPPEFRLEIVREKKSKGRRK